MQEGIKYYFCVFGITRPRIEPKSPGPLVNTNHFATTFPKLPLSANVVEYAN